MAAASTIVPVLTPANSLSDHGESTLPSPLTASSLSISTPITAASYEKYRLKIHAEAYHQKYRQLAMMVGSPVVDHCGNDFSIPPYDGVKGDIQFDKMEDIADIHRAVTEGREEHDVGLERLGVVEARKELRRPAVCILAYGIACVAIGFYAFDTQLRDIIPTLVLGCLLGWMQLVAVKKSQTISDLFPFLAAALLTASSLALGSLSSNGVPLFCWTAIAEGTIAIILPAYTMLVATAEVLRGRSISGAARLTSTVFYTMLLSLGMGCGKLLYDIFATSLPPQPMSCFDG